MIHGIRLLNFGNHGDSRFEFGAMSALVGRNGAGKTTVLRAISELARVATPARAPLESPGLPFSKQEITFPKHFIRIGGTEVGLSASGPGTKDNKTGTWGLAVEGQCDTDRKDEEGCIVEAKWSWKDSAGETQTCWLPDVGSGKHVPQADAKESFKKVRANLERELKSPVPKAPTLDVPATNPESEWLPELLDYQYLHGVGVNLHQPSYTSEIPPKISSHGDNLPSVIAYLMTSEPERFEELSDAFRQLIPIVKRVRVRPAAVIKREKKIISVNRKDVAFDEDREFNGHELVFDLKSGKGIPASVVSEGTLLSLALLTIFHTTESPRLVLIDDTEQALHPRAQRG